LTCPANPQRPLLKVNVFPPKSKGLSQSQSDGECHRGPLGSFDI
jgi:hypothetical protein